MSRAIGANFSDYDVVASGGIPAFRLGTIIQREDNREYMYVQADEALVAGNAVLVHEDFGAEQVDATSSAGAAGQGAPAGLCVAAIESGGFGFIQINGAGDVSLNVGSSCAVHTTLCSTATPGRLDDAITAGLEYIEGITTTGAESSNAAACRLERPIVGKTVLAEAIP